MDRSKHERPNPKSADIVGREPFLLHVLALASTPLEAGGAEVIRIVAPPGYGKTALMNELAVRLAADSRAITFSAAVPADGNEAELRRLLESQAPRLRSDFAPYLSGLESLLDPHMEIPPERLRLGFIRLTEALAHDVPVRVLLDDAHLCDEAAIQALDSIAKGGARVVLAQRPSENSAVTSARVLQLGPIGDDDALTIVRRLYPAASSNVAQAVVRACAGVPLDLVMLATQAALGEFSDPMQLHDSLSETIRADIAGFADAPRAVLQSCALMREPISYRLLMRIFGEAVLPEALVRAIPRYLVQGRSGFEFAHALVRDAVRTTIVVAAPLQQRILDACAMDADLAEHELNDCLDFALALGRHDDVLAQALRLARRARSNRHWHVVVRAYGAAFSENHIPHRQYLDDYLAFTNALRLLKRDEDARRFLEPVVTALACDPATSGLGALIGALANVLFGLHRIEEALSVCERYATLLRVGTERDELQSVELSLRVHAGDPAPVRTARFESLVRAPASPAIESRLRAARALVHIHRGESELVVHDLAALTAQQGASYDFTSPYLTHLQHLWRWHQYGAAVRDALLESLARVAEDPQFLISFLTLVDFAAGNWPIAFARIQEFGVSHFSALDAESALIPCAAMLAFGGKDDELEGYIREQAQVLLAEPDASSCAELLLWCSLLPEPIYTARSQHKIAAWLVRPSPLGSLYPISFGSALYAERYPDGIPAPTRRVFDRLSPWNRACDDLKDGWMHRDAMILERAAAQFDSLEAKALVRLIRHRTSAQTSKSSESPRDRLTVREQEVCLLVAEGLTNRGIAQRLFVSERTVATHVSNALAKLGAQTRTELARRIAT